MKKLLSALVAVTALSAAVPAMAYPYGGGDLRGQIEQLDNRVDRAYARHTISRGEKYRLDGMVSQLRIQYRVAMRDGRLTRWERSDLDARINRVEAALRMERRDGDGYGGRGGRGGHRY
jgi:hypothetical protein